MHRSRRLLAIRSSQECGLGIRTERRRAQPGRTGATTAGRSDSFRLRFDAHVPELIGRDSESRQLARKRFVLYRFDRGVQRGVPCGNGMGMQIAISPTSESPSFRLCRQRQISRNGHDLFSKFARPPIQAGPDAAYFPPKMKGSGTAPPATSASSSGASSTTSTTSFSSLMMWFSFDALC